MLSWIDSNEVSTSLVFSNCLTDVFLVSKLGSFFHWFNKQREVLWIIHGKFLNHLLQLLIGLVLKVIVRALSR